MTVNKLVLWDIDHTLIETGGVGSEVFRDAFEQVTGHKIDKLADVTGRTEQVIFRETLEMYEIEDPGDYFPKFVQAQAQGYRARASEMRRRGRVLPGVRDVLGVLRPLPYLVQSVLTGNTRPSAEAKLSTFDLTELLDLDSGAYGTDDSVRANLIPIAQRRASDRYGTHFTGETTTVVGDTVTDVEAAREAGVQVIAVASGSTSLSDLRCSGAQTVVTSLAEISTVVEALIKP